MIKFAFAILAAGTAGIIAFTPAPAAAQGSVGPTPAEGQRICPTGYVASTRDGRSDKTCYPNSGARAVYRNNGGKCADGYKEDNRYWCIESAGAKSSSSSSSSSPNVDYVAAQSGTGAMLTKPSKGNRCPTGWASTRDLTQCFTMVENPPTARPSGGKPCAPGEFNDWDVWCTSNYAATTKEQAYDALTVDFNRLYLRGGPVDMKGELSADATAHYGPKVYADSSSSASSSDSSKPAEQTAQNAACQEGSATGAAIGGALGGDAGAALGSMLGGLGKKKKKKTC